jgi:hypothetical protein
MHDQANTGDAFEHDISHAAVPVVVDRATFQAELDALRTHRGPHPAPG